MGCAEEVLVLPALWARLSDPHSFPLRLQSWVGELGSWLVRFQEAVVLQALGTGLPYHNRGPSADHHRGHHRNPDTHLHFDSDNDPDADSDEHKHDAHNNFGHIDMDVNFAHELHVDTDDHDTHSDRDDHVYNHQLDAHLINRHVHEHFHPNNNPYNHKLNSLPLPYR